MESAGQSVVIHLTKSIGIIFAALAAVILVFDDLLHSRSVLCAGGDGDERDDTARPLPPRERRSSLGTRPPHFRTPFFPRTLSSSLFVRSLGGPGGGTSIER